MTNTIMMIGCDLHDKSMLLKAAVNLGKPWLRSYGTKAASRQHMIKYLQTRAAQEGATRVVFAYEACGFGFLLYDELVAAGIECHVLAPSKILRSAHSRSHKTDERDAEALLAALRSHVLAAADLPSVWVPDDRTRDDRELVRRRLAVGEDLSRAKTRIRWFLKRQGIEDAPAEAWTVRYWSWLEELSKGRLGAGAGAALASLVGEAKWLAEEQGRLEKQVIALADAPRHDALVTGVSRPKGVGVLTAMVFLTELGDLRRFHNRQEVGSFLGLTPATHESGKDSDHKGHITHHGPGRVRKVLCQAIWSALRSDPAQRKAYDRLVARNPKKKKIALVARMRVLGIQMWHHGLEALAGMEASASAT